MQFTNRPLRDKLGRNPIQSSAVITQIVRDFVGPSTSLRIVINNRETELLAVALKTLFRPYENKLSLQQNGPLLRPLIEVTFV
jgi:hypothetical protein